MNIYMKEKYNEINVDRTYQAMHSKEEMNLPSDLKKLFTSSIREKLANLLPGDSLRTKREEKNWLNEVKETRNFKNVEKEVEKVDDGLTTNLLETLSIMNTFNEAIKKIRISQKIQNFILHQEFAEISHRHSSRNRFVDTEFNPINESISKNSEFFENKLGGKFSQIKWKRAKDLFNDSHFVLNHQNDYDINKINEENYRNYFDTSDIVQGCLGDCWFVAAVSGLIQNYDLLNRVIPFDNSLEDNKYTGAFHFRFWHYGVWKDVVIDDFLPVDQNNNLIFSRNNTQKNEFWSALLEKAYAKLNGSYEYLENGSINEALIEMSGGIAEEFDIKKIRNSEYKLIHSSDEKNKFVDNDVFWNLLMNVQKKNSVIGCNIQKNDRQHLGLKSAHAYSIIKTDEIEFKNKKVRLVKLLNPWGNHVEWRGDWNDKDYNWNFVNQHEKERIGFRMVEDGQFWMSYDDWLENFDRCQICNLTPEILGIKDDSWNNTKELSNIFSMWQSNFFHGEWKQGFSAGGCGKLDENKYWMNPQYSFVIDEVDEADKKCWVIIGLMQKNFRQNHMKSNQSGQAQKTYMQFRIFKANNSDEFNQLTGENIKIGKNSLEKVNGSKGLQYCKEIIERFRLEAGKYIIIPSTEYENQVGEFLLRIFTEKPLKNSECKWLFKENY